MNRFLFALILFSINYCNAQDLSWLGKKYPVLIATDVKKYRSISNDSNVIEKYNPVSLFFDFSMYFYQTTISEQFSADCSFTPSCSEFSKKLIRRYGLIKGIFLTADRLMRCNGNASNEYPHYQLDSNLIKVVDNVEYYRWQNTY